MRILRRLFLQGRQKSNRGRWGNTAATEALYLKNIGVDVTIVHRRTSSGRSSSPGEPCRKQYPHTLEHGRKEIMGDRFVTQVVIENIAEKATDTLPIDGVFVAIGYVPSNELA